MHRAAAMIFLPLALAACGDGEGTSISINATSDNGAASVSTDADGQLSIRAPGFEGSIKLPRIDIKAEDFDVNGVALPPGSTINGLHVDADDRMGQRNDGKLTVNFTSPVSLEEAKQWFRTSMTEHGFEVQASDDGFSGTTAEGDPFAVALRPSDGAEGVRGTMTVGR